VAIEIITTADGFRAECQRLRGAGHTLGFVPTMGALHEGHVSLLRLAASETSRVAVSIFVNPTQFGANEDFTRYPRTFEQDCERCEGAGASLVFAPPASEMYPAGESTRVSVAGLTAGLCGAARPGHFDGVATIVAKLFLLAGPCTAVFGKKDYQQLKVIERLARDLLLPVRVVAHAIVREADGLALSSRNAYLSAEERSRALGIVRGLSSAFREFRAGVRDVAAITGSVTTQVEAHGLVPQYVEVTDAETLEPLARDAPMPDRALLAVAAFSGRTRLIDNVVLGEDPDPLQSR